MFERFTEKAIKSIMLAQEESHRLGHNFVGTEQMLLGLIDEGTGVAAKVLKLMGVNLGDARTEVEKIIGRGSGFVAVEVPFTHRAKRVLELSLEEARQLGHNYVGTEHLLLGLSLEDEGVAARVLENLGANLAQIRFRVLLEIGDPETVKSFEKAQRLEKFHKRNRVFQALLRLPVPQFNQVIFGLDVPPGNVPPSSSPQADRVTALVEWATSQIGCGIEHLEEIIQLVIDGSH